MRARRINAAATAVFTLAAGVAAASDDAYTSSWYVVPGVSVLNAASDLQSKRTAPAVSLRLSRELSPNWDVQLGGSYGSAGSKDSYAGSVLSGHYKQTLLGADALYLFNRNKLRPFLLAGLGYARNDVDYTYAGVPVDGTKNSWMANVGVGLQYYFTDNIGLQADVRHVWSRARGIAAGTGFTDSGTIGNNYFDLGVIFKFGAPKKMAAAAPVAASSPAMEPPPQAPAEPQRSPAEPAPAPHEPVFAKVSLQAEVLFDFDKSVLKTAGKKILDEEVVEKMKAHPEVELVLITGHADRIGDDNYNQRLSKSRADSVKEYIASQGIADDRLHAIGKGETEPVVDCKGVRGKKLIVCLQPNRRVVVEIEAQASIER